MKQRSITEIIIWVLCILAMVGSVLFLLNQPHEVAPECSKEYVKIHGSKQCQLQQKAGETEIEEHNAQQSY